MIKRTIDISNPAYLHLRNGQLLIDQEKEIATQIPIEDLGVLILQSPAITLTQNLIVACQKNTVVIIFCDEKHLPYSIILPIAEGHTLHNKILQQQINISQPTRKRLWQQIIKEKIKQQVATLNLLGKDSSQLKHLITQVKSGDSSYCESIAAQKYWKLLFGNQFRRNVDADGVNALLNYGYAIVRAMIARAVCAAGLHPALGLFHHNQYNALSLADDLMEPFRAWVDYKVYRIVKDNPNASVDPFYKNALLTLLTEQVVHKQKKIPLMVASHYLMADLKRCYNREQNELTYPCWHHQE